MAAATCTLLLLAAISARADAQADCYPTSIRLTEHSFRHGDWTVTLNRVQGNVYEGKWDKTTTVSRFTVTTFTASRVVIKRQDIGGAQPHFSGTYSGTRAGNSVQRGDGSVADIGSGMGTWQATWNGGSPTGCADMPVDTTYKLLAWLGEDCSKLQMTLTYGPGLSGAIEPGHSKPCTIYIEDWRRNTSKPVVVDFPDQKDTYGGHDNGITVFPASHSNFSLQRVDPASMSGFRSGWPEAQPRHSGHEVYAWNLMISARKIPGGPVPIRVYQEGDHEKGVVHLTLNTKVDSARRPPDGSAGGNRPTTVSYVGRLVAKHSNRCLDIVGGDQSGRNNGAGAHQWDCLNVRSQEWTFRSSDGQWFQVQTGHAQKCLDINQQRTANNTRVHQWDCHTGDSQLWKVVDRGQGTFALVSKLSNRCLDIFGADTRNGAVGQLYDCTYGPNQLWTTASTSGPTSLITRLVAVHSNRCLGIAGNDQTAAVNGAVANQWDCLNVRNQVWTMSSSDGEWFQLRNGYSQKCLDLDRQMIANNTKVHQWDCHGGDSQLWKLLDRGQGMFALVSKSANRCIDIFDVSLANGAVGQLYNCHFGLNQLWIRR